MYAVRRVGHGPLALILNSAAKQPPSLSGFLFLPTIAFVSRAQTKLWSGMEINFKKNRHRFLAYFLQTIESVLLFPQESPALFVCLLHGPVYKERILWIMHCFYNCRAQLGNGIGSSDIRKGKDLSFLSRTGSHHWHSTHEEFLIDQMDRHCIICGVRTTSVSICLIADAKGKR